MLLQLLQLFQLLLDLLLLDFQLQMLLEKEPLLHFWIVNQLRRLGSGLMLLGHLKPQHLLLFHKHLLLLL